MNLNPFALQLLPDRAVISVAGEDVLAWLNDLVTCEVDTLAKGQAAYGALLSPQGKILHDLFIFNNGHDVLIDCASNQMEALLQKLTLYRLRRKLAITAKIDFEVGASADPLELETAYPDPRMVEAGWRVFSPAHVLSVGAGYHERRIALGLADSTQDIGTDKLFPHEANFDQFKGVNFSKGCYVGQEVVSRMQHRGTARNRILIAHFGMFPAFPGMDIISGATRIGEVLSVYDNSGLALVRLDRLAEAPERLMAGPALVTLAAPPWLKVDVTIPDAAR